MCKSGTSLISSAASLSVSREAVPLPMLIRSTLCFFARTASDYGKPTAKTSSVPGSGYDDEQPLGEPQYEFLPSAESILDEIVPMSFKVRLFKCFLDAAVSEQIARMVAMKAATENADSMISQLSMAYNRARQGQITNELLEIIGGAEALNE